LKVTATEYQNQEDLAVSGANSNVATGLVRAACSSCQKAEAKSDKYLFFTFNDRRKNHGRRCDTKQ